MDDRRGRAPVGRRGVSLGCGGLVVLILFAVMTGRDPQQLVEILDQAQVSVGSGPAPGSSLGGSAGSPGAAPGDQLGEFASVVLADTEQTWNELFPQLGLRYREPTLVLFSNAVRSACGLNSAAVGPFYCPADQQVYIDLSFFAELDRRMGAPGDFAQAYVIAHEVGHHVQNLLGISDHVRQERRRASRAEGNALSVRLELQADCLAGVWGHHAHRQRQLLEPGDVEEGLNAAAAIGDDKLQRDATGTTRPESWTHGSSRQRQAWLQRGLETGDPNVCDTFASG